MINPAVLLVLNHPIQGKGLLALQVKQICSTHRNQASICAFVLDNGCMESHTFKYCTQVH